MNLFTDDDEVYQNMLFTMGKIIKRLERQYGIQIDNRFEQLEERRFTGMFDEESIDRVLRTIQAHTHFSYDVKNEMIIINEPHKQ